MTNIFQGKTFKPQNGGQGGFVSDKPGTHYVELTNYDFKDGKQVGRDGNAGMLGCIFEFRVVGSEAFAEGASVKEILTFNPTDPPWRAERNQCALFDLFTSFCRSKGLDGVAESATLEAVGEEIGNVDGFQSAFVGVVVRADVTRRTSKNRVEYGTVAYSRDDR